MTNQVQLHDWTFLSNHSHVLLCISYWPDIRIRDIAVKVRITERAVQRILVDLERGGYLKRERVGRQNRYRVETELHLRHPLAHHVEVGQFLAALQPETVALKKRVQNRKQSTARGRNSVPSRAGARTISRLKKTPRKLRKLMAAKSR
jgi:DNA-binding MarR family transcriptional regulator